MKNSSFLIFLYTFCEFIKCMESYIVVEQAHLIKEEYSPLHLLLNISSLKEIFLKTVIFLHHDDDDDD